MKCNANLIRYILLSVESCQKSDYDIRIFENAEYSGDEITDHANLLSNAGYLNTYRGDTLSRKVTFVGGITMRGYEFLNSIRDDRTWVRVLKEIAKAAAPIAFSSIEEIAKKISGRS